jgi:hypothetical protein
VNTLKPESEAQEMSSERRLLFRAMELPPSERFRLAFLIAESLGYGLVKGASDNADVASETLVLVRGMRMDGPTEQLPGRTEMVSEVFATSNGHHWVRWRQFICCRDCGIIRRADDRNKPCPGIVRVGPRVSRS